MEACDEQPAGREPAAQVAQHGGLGVRREEDHHVAGEHDGVERSGDVGVVEPRKVGEVPGERRCLGSGVGEQRLVDVDAARIEAAGGETDRHPSGSTAGVEHVHALLTGDAGADVAQQPLDEIGLAVRLAARRREPLPTCVVRGGIQVDSPRFVCHSCSDRRNPFRARERTICEHTRKPTPEVQERCMPDPTAMPAPSGAPPEPEAMEPGAVDAASALLERTLFEVKRVIVGQDRMVERLLVCLLARGHCLLEGVPGLAKTLAAETLAATVRGGFARIQFTPDLMPSDLVGTRIYRPSSEQFDVELGPIFTNFVLADEINRAPAKVQSALLEVMAERQVSIGGHHPPGARAVPRAGHAEPDRVRRRLRACRKRSAIASC